MEEQERRHLIAENFRRQIEMPTQRSEAVRTLLAKESFDESDKIRIKELLRKTSYADPCEDDYLKLIARLCNSGDNEFKRRAEDFYRRWNA